MVKLAKRGVGMPFIVMTMGVVVLLIFVAVSYAQNANGILNWFAPDVTSGTPTVPSCEPKKYLVEMKGTLDLINDFIGWGGYEIHYLDAHISDISISQRLGIVSNDFESRICLYDVLANVGGTPKQVSCVSIDGSITKGRIEKFPFMFTYNLYDNDCNGVVDDHTFNLVAEVATEDGFERYEKTIAVKNGQGVFQNAEY